MGRIRDGVHWGPRIIDCDILLYGDRVIATNDLTVPHPEMTKRTFVMVPLVEIAGDIKMPSGELVSALCDACSMEGIKKLEG